MAQPQQTEINTIEVNLSRQYMPEAEANALAEKYKGIICKNYISADRHTCILDVFAGSIVNLTNSYLEMISPDGGHSKQVVFNYASAPAGGDWAVSVNYLKNRFNSEISQWEPVVNKHGGYEHSACIFDIINEHQIELITIENHRADVLKRYMPEFEAKALEAKYENLLNENYISGDCHANILTISSGNMTGTCLQYYHTVRAATGKCMPVIIEHFPARINDDWALSVSYIKYRFDHYLRQWERVRNEHGGYEHCDFAVDFAKEYNIALPGVEK